VDVATQEPIYDAATVIAGLRSHPTNWIGRTIRVRGTVWVAMYYSAHAFGPDGPPFPEGVWIGPPHDVPYYKGMPRWLQVQMATQRTWMNRNHIVKAVVFNGASRPIIGPTVTGSLVLALREEPLNDIQRVLVWAGLGREMVSSPMLGEMRRDVVSRVRLTGPTPCVLTPCPVGELLIPVP